MTTFAPGLQNEPTTFYLEIAMICAGLSRNVTSRPIHCSILWPFSMKNSIQEQPFICGSEKPSSWTSHFVTWNHDVFSILWSNLLMLISQFFKFKASQVCNTIRVSVVENFWTTKVCAMPRDQAYRRCCHDWNRVIRRYIYSLGYNESASCH